MIWFMQLTEYNDKDIYVKYLFQDKNLETLLEVLHLVGYQDPYFVPQVLHDAIVKNMTSYMGINSTQWVIQEVYVSIAVYGSGKQQYIIITSHHCHHCHHHYQPSLSSLSSSLPPKSLSIHLCLANYSL